MRIAALLLVCSSTSFAVSYAENAPGVNTFTAVDRVTWRDSKGLNRDLYFARTYPNPVVPQIMGYVTRLTWQPDANSARIIAEEDPSGINASNAQGWGTNVMHMHWLQYGGVHPVFGSGASATTSKRDGFDFVQGAVFLGPHHLIYRVTFKQYTMLIHNVVPRPFVYVTIDWFISDGLDHVVYAITLDASRDFRSNSVAYLNNCLAPYSLAPSAAWKGTTDWAGGTDGPDGESWGDFKTFLTNDNVSWTYGGTNTVPYVWQWVRPEGGRGDAEAAYVQTETYSQKRAGESFAQGRDASGTRMPIYPDLQGEEYAYQLNFFDSYNSKRLTWGMRSGLLYGGGGATPGYQNYSVAMHLGKFSEHGARALIDETAALHDGSIQVQSVVGSLLSSGPEGSGNPTPHTYSPRGYNQVYRTWELQSVGNAVEVTFDVGSGSYRRPVFVVHGFTGHAGQVVVRLNGAALPADAFAASLDDAADKLYVTLLSMLGGVSSIQIQDAMTPPLLPVTSVTVTPTSVTMEVQATTAFTATARDSAGVVMPNEPITWSAPSVAGSFNGSVFTASCTPGFFVLTARTANGPTGTAQVRVVEGAAARLEVSPEGERVRSRKTQQYAVVVRDACDNVLTGQAVTWSSSAGTITQSGLFAASCTRASSASGVTASLGALHSSAAVTVIEGEPYAITVIPGMVSLQVGGTQQFAAVPRDECGNALNDSVTWSANSVTGEFTSSGLFTAGQNVGSHPGSVVAEIGSVMGSAWVMLIGIAPVDAGAADAGDVDAGVIDAGVADAGVADAGVADAGVVDAGRSDGGHDAGEVVGEKNPALLPAMNGESPAAGCGCHSTDVSLCLLALFALVTRSPRARRGAGPPQGSRRARMAS